ncbi:type II secretion system GspH family protein [Patescibacteria group bacterium]|nr:type II secretion system GspH family protein [Patescibacteria group bacterium]
MELLVVMSIFSILGAMTFSAFGNLQNTVKMNEYALTLEQDVRSVQRSAMLLERSSGEKWLYGLGIDFGDLESNDDGLYTAFKWCSPFVDYGDILTKSSLPAYTPSKSLGAPTGIGSESNGYLTVSSIGGSCGTNATSSLSILPGYDKSTTTPISDITITEIDGKKPRFVVFESVSGRTFFYADDGELLNYTTEGKLEADPKPFVITINPQSDVNTRIITIGNLSGKINTESVQ